MSLKPINVKLDEFFDYILENILKKIAHLRQQCGLNIRIRSSIERSTTYNCCESFHSKFNSCFYSAHLNIFQFMNVFK
ncbi:Uncharacterized protein FWK35_00035828 [Aphis craccivora]|uniref:Uncharacterized protein n=1 Tax=Aphis craccivora TaxID=307492 RepID=A0A6G0XSY8_APHCR|nr:Uncharacterized protein FWK35_00035828 [Aphis craccivora]